MVSFAFFSLTRDGLVVGGSEMSGGTGSFGFFLIGALKFTPAEVGPRALPPGCREMDAIASNSGKNTALLRFFLSSFQSRTHSVGLGKLFLFLYHDWRIPSEDRKSVV